MFSTVFNTYLKKKYVPKIYDFVVMKTILSQFQYNYNLGTEKVTKGFMK